MQSRLDVVAPRPNPRVGTVGTEVSDTPAVPNAPAAVRSLFAALNARDVSAVLTLLADDVLYENLGASTALRGRSAVGRFYLEALAALPEDAVFVLEEPGGGQDPWVTAGAGPAVVPVLQAGVAWHLELNGMVVPLSRGVSVFWADPRTGRLARIWDNPEHTVKQAAPALTSAAWASPLLRNLGPLVMPAARSVSSFLNTLTPGAASEPGLGVPAAAAAAAGSGSLASGMVSAITGMMPFQAAAPPAAAAPALAPGRPAEGSRGADGTAAAAAGLSGRPLYRDHTRTAAALPAATTAGVAARISASGQSGGVPSAASLSISSGNGTGSVLAASGRVAPVDRAALPAGTAAGAAGAPAAPARAPAHPSSSSILGLPSPSVPSAASLSGLPKTPTAAPALAPSAAVPSAFATTSAGASAGTGAAAATSALRSSSTTTTTSTGSSQDTVRMRALPGPEPPSSPPVSAASSFASVDDDVPGVSAATATEGTSGKAPAASTTSPAPAPFSTTSAAATSSSTAAVGTAAVAVAASKPVVLVVPGGSTDSVNSFAGDEGPATALPFRPSTSMGVNMSGLWEKDTAASQVQEYEAMLDVLQLGGLQKVTARLIDGIDVLHDDKRFEVGFVTVVPFFRVTEKSQFGAPSSMMRRDLRSGRQTSQAARVPGGVTVDMSWGAPLAGGLREEYVVSEDGGVMAVTSTVSIGGRTAAATQVYRRSQRNKSDFLASKRSSYGSLQDVLDSQEKKYGKMNK